VTTDLLRQCFSLPVIPIKTFTPRPPCPNGGKCLSETPDPPSSAVIRIISTSIRTRMVSTQEGLAPSSTVADTRRPIAVRDGIVSHFKGRDRFSDKAQGLKDGSSGSVIEIRRYNSF